MESKEPTTYRQRLEELRDLLRDRLKVAGSRDAASLAKQYRDTLAALEELDRGKTEEGSIGDELAKRRAARRAEAQGS
jgi:hypothetical protein